MDTFTGAKIALFCNNKIVTILRDEKPNLDYSGMWDLPGGGREGQEALIECISREVFEELHIELAPESITYQKIYPVLKDPSLMSYFLVGQVTEDQINGIIFGNEGQRWELITVDEFLNHRSSVPYFKIRFHDFFNSNESDQYVGARI